MALDEGWSASRDEPRGERLRVLLSRDAFSDEQVALRVFPSDATGGPDGARRLTIASVENREAYSEPVVSTARLDGAEHPALTVDLLEQDPILRLRHVYLEHADHVLVLESVAPREVFDARWEDFEEVWGGLTLVDPMPADPERAALERLAARCGTDVRWAGTWEEAAARARSEQKPILLALRSYRGFQISDPSLSTVFMDPAWIELLNTRTVPLRATSAADMPFATFDAYGLSETTFGATWLVITPDGDVVGDHAFPGYRALVENLDRLADCPGESVDPSLAGLERARALAARGDLDGARDELGAAPADRLFEVELARRELDAERMLGLLEEIESEDLADELAAEASIARVQALMGAGRVDEAARALEGTRAAHGDLGGRVALLEGTLRWSGGEREVAGDLWRALIEEHPESDSAAIAAATMLGTSWAAGIEPWPAWPAARDLEELAPGTHAPLEVSEAASLRGEVLGRLLTLQREDGSWFERSAAGRKRDRAPHDFELATTSLALRALLRAPRSKAVEASIERGIAHVIDGWGAQRADADAVLFMDYAVWSRACILDLLAEAAAAGWVDSSRATELAEVAFDELVTRVQPNQGWSYYLTSDLQSGATTQQSISFTTAAVAIAMLRAREAGLLQGERVDGTIGGALDQLERMRDRDGEFAYMQAPGTSDPGDVSSSGAAGRGPVCTLALLRGGRVEASALVAALDRFVAYRGAYTREVGRALMHTGREGEGSHYLTWDYAMAAEAIEDLPGEEGRRFVEPVLEALLQTRLDDGTYLGSPLLGRAHGAAEAARAFAHLGL